MSDKSKNDIKVSGLSLSIALNKFYEGEEMSTKLKQIGSIRKKVVSKSNPTKEDATN